MSHESANAPNAMLNALLKVLQLFSHSIILYTQLLRAEPSSHHDTHSQFEALNALADLQLYSRTFSYVGTGPWWRQDPKVHTF